MQPNKIDLKVGYYTTSMLEELCREQILSATEKKDYKLLTEYIIKYERLRCYNGRTKQD